VGLTRIDTELTDLRIILVTECLLLADTVEKLGHFLSLKDHQKTDLL